MDKGFLKKCLLNYSIFLIICFNCALQQAFGQGVSGDTLNHEFYEPAFSEAENMAWFEKQPLVYDSLKKVNINRWSIGIALGKRFISSENIANIPDTITFTNFAERKSFIGFELGYYPKNKIHTFFSIDLLVLPKKEDIGTITYNGPNGIQIEGSGSGGLMVNLGFGLRYYLYQKITKPFIGFEAGKIQAIAKGGTGGFSTGNGQFKNINNKKANYHYFNILTGINHRMSPKTMLEFNMGYMFSSKSENIGKILSPGGFNFSIGMNLLMVSKKYQSNE